MMPCAEGDAVSKGRLACEASAATSAGSCAAAAAAESAARRLRRAAAPASEAKGSARMQSRDSNSCSEKILPSFAQHL